MTRDVLKLNYVVLTCQLRSLQMASRGKSKGLTQKKKYCCLREVLLRKFKVKNMICTDKRKMTRAAAREEQERIDFEKALELQKQLDEREETNNIDWNTVAEQVQERQLGNSYVRIKKILEEYLGSKTITEAYQVFVRYAQRIDKEDLFAYDSTGHDSYEKLNEGLRRVGFELIEFKINDLMGAISNKKIIPENERGDADDVCDDSDDGVDEQDLLTDCSGWWSMRSVDDDH
ncbi:hypothetical protein Tco_0174632 [Tanacetum coccineum]